MLQRAMLNFALLGAEWVLWLLVGLSVLVVFVSAERAWWLVSNGTPGAALERALDAFLTGGTREDLDRALRGLKGTEARVLLAGLTAGVQDADAGMDAIAGTLAFERLQMERGLILIGTVASNAPFIGLFGTVLGIIQAFHDLSIQSKEAANAVMAGISEALVSTAVGLLVAIPAVVLFNTFQRRIRARVGRCESLGQLILSRLRAA